MIRNKPSLTITISPKIAEKLEKNKYNKSKLIDSLLSEYFQNNENVEEKYKK